jgi:hypothetical protein
MHVLCAWTDRILTYFTSFYDIYNSPLSHALVYVEAHVTSVIHFRSYRSISLINDIFVTPKRDGRWDEA